MAVNYSRQLFELMIPRTLCDRCGHNDTSTLCIQRLTFRWWGLADHWTSWCLLGTSSPSRLAVTQYWHAHTHLILIHLALSLKGIMNLSNLCNRCTCMCHQAHAAQRATEALSEFFVSVLWTMYRSGDGSVWVSMRLDRGSVGAAGCYLLNMVLPYR